MLRLELASRAISRGRFAGAGALGVAAVLLIVLGVVLNINLGRLRDSLVWVQHSNDILLQTGGLEHDLAQAEGDARAYALTSDRSYLAAMETAHRGVDRHLAALRSLVADNAAQTRNLDIVQPLFQARLAMLEWFTRLSPTAARALAISAQKSAMMLREDQHRIISGIGAQLAAFRNRETGLLATRQILAQRDTRFLNFLALFAAVIAASSGGYGIYLLIRESHDARARELELELMHAQRLGLMGQNSSALAHELNQPLTAATNYLGALRRFLSVAGDIDRTKALELTQRISDQIGRVGAVVRRLRDFIDKRDGELTAESPATLVADAIALLATFEDSAELTTEIDRGLPDVLRRSRASAAGSRQSDAKRDRSDAGQSAARAAADGGAGQIRLRRIPPQRHRPGLVRSRRGAAVSALRLHKAGWDGCGPFDLPENPRRAWRADLGGIPRRRRHLLLCDSRAAAGHPRSRLRRRAKRSIAFVHASAEVAHAAAENPPASIKRSSRH